MDNKTFEAIRKSKGYSQKELASLLEMSPEHISRLENGHSRIRKVLELAMENLPKK